MYGLENLLLNQPHPTSWYNLGYWQPETNSFVTACEGLARIFAEKGQFKKGESLLDLGCGCADQDIFWLREYHLKSIIGINGSKPQLAYAQQKIENADLNTQITIVDAPFETFETKQNFDIVCSLDAAYHFDKTKLFALAAARAHRLVFTDLTPPQGGSPLLLNFLISLAGIRKKNLLPLQQMHALAAEFGFKPMIYEDLSEPVLGGYANFIQTHGPSLRQKHGLKVQRFLLTGRVLGYIFRRALLGYSLFVYEKK